MNNLKVSGKVIERLITTNEGNHYLFIELTGGEASGRVWVKCDKDLAEGSEFTGTFTPVDRESEVDKGDFHTLEIDGDVTEDKSFEFETHTARGEVLP